MVHTKVNAILLFCFIDTEVAEGPIAELR